MKLLIVTVGLPRSGKSTWAKTTGFPIVSPDSIRIATHGKRFYLPGERLVWATAFIMVRSLFHSEHNTIVFDATSLTKRARNEIVHEMRIFLEDDIEIKYKYFDTSIEVCKERALATYPDLVDVIERMSKHYEPLEYYEELYVG